MVENFSLEEYLGFKLRRSVKAAKKFNRVIRTKNTDSWRYWFTTEDISFFRPLCFEFMKIFGYDLEDWDLPQKKKILAGRSSAYVKKLVNERRLQAGMAIIS